MVMTGYRLYVKGLKYWCFGWKLLFVKTPCLEVNLGRPPGLSAGHTCTWSLWTRDAIDRIHAHGIAIEGAFIFGLDHDTRGVFEETIRFAKENRLEAAQFGILTPLPGTDLYRRLEEENRITCRDWAKYNIANVVFKPRNMSVAVLQEGFKRAWLEFYSYTSILYRLGLARKHGSFLWALNMGFHERVMRLLQPAAGET